MRVLVIGSGAREHALTWKALQSPLTRAVFCVPGNAATAAIAVNLPGTATDARELARLVVERGIDLAIVGPDAAIAAGVCDAIAATGVPVFGPSAAAGRIESSKVFAKQLMRKAGVSTPAFHVFDEPAAAKAFVRSEDRPFVVKADGLAKGKGSLVPPDVPQTLEAIDSLMLARSVGDAARQIVIEERISGREVSLQALVDGERVVTLAPACDYKRALDGDRGPNTGGMGAYSPVPFFSDEDLEEARARVLQPVVDALREAGTPYRGCLYAGLMMTAGGIQALEFNARFGDPETQVILPRVEGDLMPALLEAASGRLSPSSVTWSARAAVGVVLASRGYPAAFETGHLIEGLATLQPDAFAFHAGTTSGPDGYRTAGGRVLTVVALGDSIAQARERAYENVDRVRFQGMAFRRDIAERELKEAVIG